MPSRALLDIKSKITAAAAIKDSAFTGPAFDIIYCDKGQGVSTNVGTLANPFNTATALTDAHTAAGTLPTIIFVKESSAVPGAEYLKSYLDSVIVTKSVLYVSVGKVWWGPVNANGTSDQLICYSTLGPIGGLHGTIGFNFWGSLTGSHYRKGTTFSHYVGDFKLPAGGAYSEAGEFVCANNTIAFTTMMVVGSPSPDWLADLTGAATKPWVIEENDFIFGSVSHAGVFDAGAPTPSPTLVLVAPPSYGGAVRFGGQSKFSLINNNFKLFDPSVGSGLPLKGAISAVNSGLMTIDIASGDLTDGTLSGIQAGCVIRFLDGDHANRGEFEITNNTGGDPLTLTLKAPLSLSASDLVGISATETFIGGWKLSGIVSNYVNPKVGGVGHEGYMSGYLDPAGIAGNTFTIQHGNYSESELSPCELSLDASSLFGTKIHVAKSNIYHLSGIDVTRDKLLSKASMGYGDVEDPDLKPSTLQADNAFVDLSSVRSVANKTGFLDHWIWMSTGIIPSYPDGTIAGHQDSPIATENDLLLLVGDVASEAENFIYQNVMLDGAFTMTVAYSDWTFKSWNGGGQVDVNGQLLTNVRFIDVDMVGTPAGGSTYEEIDSRLFALESNATSNTTAINANIDANEAKIDIIDTAVDGIQTDLDNGTDGLGALKTLIDAVPTDAENAYAVWEEVINNSSHNGAQSAGKRLRQAGSLVAAEGEAVGTPTASSIVTDLTETTSSFYADQTLVFLSGNLTGEARVITTYDGGTKTVTFDEPFAFAPVATDEFAIFADHVHPVSQIATAIDVDAVNNMNTVIAEIDANEAKIDIVDIVVDAIKLKTDLLPADPASETNVNANETKIDSIKVDTGDILADTSVIEPLVSTNLDAAISSRATPANITASEANLKSEIDANEVKIDALQTDLTSVKGTVDLNLDATISSRASSAEISALSAIVALETTSQAIQTAVNEINLETDPGAIATAVLDAILSSHTVSGSMGKAISDILSEATLTRKSLTNRLELFDGGTGNWILYDDDSSTPLLTFDVKDKAGASITLELGIPAKRTKGV